MDGFSRDDVDAYAVESQKRAANAWEKGYFTKSVIPVKDILGQTILDRDEHMRPDATMQSLASLKPSFEQLGDFAGFDAVAQQRYPQVEKINHVHHAGNSSGIVDGAAAVLLGTKEAGERAGPEAARAHPRLRLHRLGALHHAHRPGAGDREGAEARRHDGEGHRSVRTQRSVRLRRAALHEGARHSARQDQCERRRHRHGPSARRHRRA